MSGGAAVRVFRETFSISLEDAARAVRLTPSDLDLIEKGAAARDGAIDDIFVALRELVKRRATSAPPRPRTPNPRQRRIVRCCSRELRSNTADPDAHGRHT